MKPTIAFFGSSLVSAYWNGAATYYRGVIRALHEAEPGHPPKPSGSEAAADFSDGPIIVPSRAQEGSRAMAGSLDADTDRRTLHKVAARISLSPSCTWLSPLPRNHERHFTCSISIVLSSTGEGASSS